MVLKNASTSQGNIQVIGLIILVVGLVIAAYLVRHPQVLKSRADSSMITILSDSGTTLPVDPTQNLTLTHSLNIQIQLNPPSTN